MKVNKRYENQKYFWEYAGEIGYGRAMFSNDVVENHIMTRHWQAAISAAKSLGLDENSTILELGCGDGKFAEEILAVHFKRIDAFDISETAIKRAQTISTTGKVSYFVKDVTEYEYDENDYWDGVFLMGFLHHVKPYTSTIVSRLAKVCPNAIVVDPNGDNLLRKLFEILPSYDRAGEDSFRLKELINIFESNGYSSKSVRRLMLVPPFLPKTFFPLLEPLERVVESTTLLNRLCYTYIIGFQRPLSKFK